MNESTTLLPCEICQVGYPNDQLLAHQERCQVPETQDPSSQTESLKTKSPPQKYLPPELTPAQQQAVTYSLTKSQVYSKGVLGNLLVKIKEMGYTKSHLIQTLKYVMEEVPVLIHVKYETIRDYLLKDTHYRSLFEVHRSGGSTSTSYRETKDSAMFNKLYAKAKPEERVKYGALNLLNSSRGIASASAYGPCCLVLHPEVKKRCTFVYGNSSKSHLHMGSFRGFAHILYYLPIAILKGIIQKAHQEPTDDFVRYTYVEAQIHGPVRLGEDLMEIRLSQAHRNQAGVETTMNAFQEKHGCPWRWMV